MAGRQYQETEFLPIMVSSLVQQKVTEQRIRLSRPSPSSLVVLKTQTKRGVAGAVAQ